MNHKIPLASLNRIKAAYATFEQTAQVVAEAMGIDPTEQYRINLQEGVFSVEESHNGRVSESEMVSANTQS